MVPRAIPRYLTYLPPGGTAVLNAFVDAIESGDITRLQSSHAIHEYFDARVDARRPDSASHTVEHLLQTVPHATG